MLRFRISDSFSHAIDFQANNHNDFLENVLPAAQSYRRHTVKKIHHGEISKNKIYFPAGYLHLYINDTWYNLGTIKQASGKDFFQSGSFMILPATETDFLEQVLSKDAMNLVAMIETITKHIQDTQLWIQGIDDQIKQTVDQIDDQYLTTAQAAARLGITESGVRRMILRGKLAAWKPSPRTILIRREDIETAERSKAGRPKRKGRS